MFATECEPVDAARSCLMEDAHNKPEKRQSAGPELPYISDLRSYGDQMGNHGRKTIPVSPFATIPGHLSGFFELCGARGGVRHKSGRSTVLNDDPNHSEIGLPTSVFKIPDDLFELCIAQNRLEGNPELWRWKRKQYKLVQRILGKRDCEILELWCDDWDVREIAEWIGEPKSTVWDRIQAATRKLVNAAVIPAQPSVN